MSFVLSEDQRLLRDTATSFFNDVLPISRLRELRDSKVTGFDQKIREKLAELGFFGVIIPDEIDGDHFGMVGLGQILEAQGRTLAPTPLIQTALTGVSAIQLGGNIEQKLKWLQQIASGESTFALAIDESGHHAPFSINTRVVKEDRNYILTGKKHYVPDGHRADMFIVVARTSRTQHSEKGLTLLLVPSDASGVTIEPLKTVDSHGAAHIVFKDVSINSDAILGEHDQGSELLNQILDRTRIGLSAEMLGSMQAAFDMTLDYLKTRKQFGQLIGSFQSLQHRAAKMFSEMELTRSCIAKALSCVDTGKKGEIAQYASLAKARACETLNLISNEAVQMHGGIGMTDEHDIGLFLKRARVQETLYGGASFHRDRFATLNEF